MGIAISFSSQNEKFYSLYTDKKGRQVGDVVTILVVENAQAKNNTQTTTDKKNDIGISSDKGSGLLDWLPGFGVSAKTDIGYKGQGNTARNGELKATVSAKIVSVLDNGNLLIDGSKQVTLNNETETITVNGLIRPEDISSANTVFSYKIADAVISYSGAGDTENGHRPGLFARFFNWLF